MRNISLLLVLAVSITWVSSCNSPKKEHETETKSESGTLDKQWARSFIDSTNAVFAKQLASGDSSGLADHYWPDAELMLDYSEAVKGKDILNAWGGAIRMGITGLDLTTTDITGTPDFIIETGRYEMKGNGKTLDKGKYVVVWEMRNDQWKIYRDIGSTSLAATK